MDVQQELRVDLMDIHQELRVDPKSPKLFEYRQLNS